MSSCSLPKDTVARVKTAANDWLVNGDKGSFDTVVYSLLDLTKSGDLKVSHFAACTLGDVLARNKTSMDAYHFLSDCVKAFDFKQAKNKINACDDQNIWDLETGLWNSHVAGQLARLLLRFNKGREALEHLQTAEKFLQRENTPDLYKYDPSDVLTSKNAIEGFRGLILRTTLEYSKAEQHLAFGRRLTAVKPPPVADNHHTESSSSLLLGSKKLRWWGREDIREMYINHGDLLARKSQFQEAQLM
jgi:hypothetical protein